MEHYEKKFKWCLNKGDTGEEKHRGLRKIRPDKKLAKSHIEKALHNLEAIEYNIRGGFGDWAVSASFYAMYHSLLAILFCLGYESRNQECTINAIEYFNRKNMISLDLKYADMIKRTGELKGSEAMALRETFQYGVEVEVSKEILESLRSNAKELVEAVRIVIEEVSK